MSTETAKRVLIGKVGLDGHDRGAKFIVRALRDAGYEVIYTGIRRTPEQIVRTAVDEDVDVIGLSLLSGAHNELFARVADLLKDEGAEKIILFGGGTIPQQDLPLLKSLGFKRVFTPGTSMSEILRRTVVVVNRPAGYRSVLQSQLPRDAGREGGEALVVPGAVQGEPGVGQLGVRLLDRHLVGLLGVLVVGPEVLDVFGEVDAAHSATSRNMKTTSMLPS